MYPKGKTDTNKTTCLFQKSLSIVEIPELEDNLRKWIVSIGQKAT